MLKAIKTISRIVPTILFSLCRQTKYIRIAKRIGISDKKNTDVENILGKGRTKIKDEIISDTEHVRSIKTLIKPEILL
jgi:hypothetical protein